MQRETVWKVDCFENTVEQTQWYAKLARPKNGVVTQSDTVFGMGVMRDVRFSPRLDSPSSLPPPASALLPVHVLLEGMRHGQHGSIIKLASGHHEPDR